MKKLLYIFTVLLFFTVLGCDQVLNPDEDSPVGEPVTRDSVMSVLSSIGTVETQSYTKNGDIFTIDGMPQTITVSGTILTVEVTMEGDAMTVMASLELGEGTTVEGSVWKFTSISLTTADTSGTYTLGTTELGYIYFDSTTDSLYLVADNFDMMHVLEELEESLSIMREITYDHSDTQSGTYESTAEMLRTIFSQTRYSCKDSADGSVYYLEVDVDDHEGNDYAFTIQGNTLTLTELDTNWEYDCCDDTGNDIATLGGVERVIQTFTRDADDAGTGLVGMWISTESPVRTLLQGVADGEEINMGDLADNLKYTLTVISSGTYTMVEEIDLKSSYTSGIATFFANMIEGFFETYPTVIMGTSSNVITMSDPALTSDFVINISEGFPMMAFDFSYGTISGSMVMEQDENTTPAMCQAAKESEDLFFEAFFGDLSKAYPSVDDLSDPEPNTAVILVKEDDFEDQSVEAGEEYVYEMWHHDSGDLRFKNVDLGVASGGNSNTTFTLADETVSGAVTHDGTTNKFTWSTPGGQVFPSQSCDMTITSPYTGASGSEFTGQAECVVESGGYTLNIYVKFNITEE